MRSLTHMVYLIALFFLNLLFFISITMASGTFGRQSSDTYLVWGFDFVETFDNLQDWTGTGTQDVINPNDMPKLSDGTQGQWDYFSHWGTAPTTQKWIADHGTANVIGGSGKSLIIDLGDPSVVTGLGSGITSSKGPSRLGLYFGDGTPNSGYDDIYIFWRFKMAKNYFPQDSEGNLEWAQVNKFFAVSMGFTSPSVWNYNPSPNGTCHTNTYSPGGYWPYSPDNFSPNLKNSKYKCNFSPLFDILSGLNAWPATWAEENGCTYFEFDKWVGVEFRFKRGNNYPDRATVQAWFYSEDGSETLIYENSNFELHFNTCCDNQKWNRFFFGGNNSLTWTWDYNTMVSHYYIDDFIINGSRIGPKYFQIISPPSPPTGLKISSP